MGKTLAEHRFSNGRRIALELLSAEEQAAADVRPEDVLALKFGQPDKQTMLVLRPDEAMATIRVLAQGTYNAVEGYTVKR